jgi:hypothetical protein
MSVARDDGAFHGVPSASIYQRSNFGSDARSFAKHVADLFEPASGRGQRSGPPFCIN